MVVIWSKNIKELVGKVLSTKMQNTVVVQVSRSKTHPLYKKSYTSLKKYYAHCTLDWVETGSIVKIRETRPISKLKRRIVLSIVS
jgi:small subunit ribosomal protein S17